MHITSKCRTTNLICFEIKIHCGYEQMQSVPLSFIEKVFHLTKRSVNNEIKNKESWMNSDEEKKYEMKNCNDGGRIG